MNASTTISFRKAALAVALCAAFVAGCGQDKPEKLIGSAKEYIAKQDYQASIIQLKNALQEQPQNGEARYLLGVALAETGDNVSAEKEFQRALEYKYSPDLVYPRLAKTMLALGDPKKMVADLGSVNLTDPAAQAGFKSTLGEAYLGLGQVKEARAVFAAALAAKPGYPQARVGEARLMAIDRDLAGAMKVTEEVLAQSPALPEALSLKADLLLAENKPDDAVKVMGELVKAQPYNAQTRFALGSLLIGLKQYDQAAAEIESMKKAIPQDVRSRYLEALLAFRKGDAAKARDPIQQVLKVAPDHAPTLLLAGAIEYQLGAFGTAEEHLRKVLSRYPNSVYARNLLTATYLRTGQAGKAEETIEPALRVAPKDPAVLRLAGEVALANNRLADASKYYDQAVALDKDNAMARTRLAQVRLATGDTDRAFKDLEEASGLDDTQYQADLSLITAHLRRKEFDQALAATATLEKKQPNNPLTYNVKGVVLAAKGDVKGARAAFEKALSLQFNYLPAARNLARFDLADKKPEDAKKRFESILAKEPKNEGAILALAELQVATGAPAKEVAETLERAVNANPTSVGARLALIRYYGQIRDNKSALNAAQAASAALPNDTRIMEALGATQFATGDTNQAIATFNKLAGALPQSPMPFMRLAAVHFAAKDYDATIQALRKALAIQPDLLEAQREIIVTQLAAGRVDDALKEAREVQKARPKEAIGFAMEGDVLATQKKFAEGAKVYEEASKRQPGPGLVVRQHQLLTAANQAAQADAVAAKWLKDNPKDPAVRLYLADVELREKDYRTAARYYKEVVAIQPDSALALNNLAWVSNELKDPAAMGYAEKAYGLAPGNAAVADTYGWLLFGKGDTKRALEILGKAAAAAPNAAEIRLHYAQALIKSGDKAAAKKELDAIVALGDKSPFKAEAEQLLKGL